jgi:hypothetical protein
MSSLAGELLFNEEHLKYLLKEFMEEYTCASPKRGTPKE